MRQHTVQNQGDAGYAVLDANGNFYARTYSSVDARLIAQAPAMLAWMKARLCYDQSCGDEACHAARAILRAVEGAK